MFQMTGFEFCPEATEQQKMATVFPPGQHYCVMRPLVENIPEGDAGWVDVTCDRCGRPCWKRPHLEPTEYPTHVHPVCTNCALAVGAGAPLCK